jgi:hypothetical protein
MKPLRRLFLLMALLTEVSKQRQSLATHVRLGTSRARLLHIIQVTLHQLITTPVFMIIIAEIRMVIQTFGVQLPVLEQLGRLAIL